MKKIGFDFDKVFVEYPPFIPDSVIERLYKKKSSKLTYRIPGVWEQKVRILSHYIFLRAPIKSHIKLLKALHKTHKYELYLISSRFSFLKEKTESWLEKYMILPFFNGVYFNFENKQPHEFKNVVLQKLAITDYIDDDLDSLEYLAKKNPSVHFYWLYYNKEKRHNKCNDTIISIKNLQEFIEHYL